MILQNLVINLIIVFKFYFKILLITKIDVEELDNSLNLALIRWYDFKHQGRFYAEIRKFL
jgi:hypothetical protein